jgi:hypothetical protein
MTPEQHADAILRAAHPNRRIPAYTDAERAAILAAVQACYDAGKDARSKEIGPYMKVDPAAIMPQSGGITVDRHGNIKTTFRSASYDAD